MRGQHTPGPWAAVDAGGGEWHITAAGRLIAKTYGANAEADARLMAASPVLFAAGEHAAAHIEAHVRTARLLNGVPWYVASVPNPSEWLHHALAIARGWR